jgi:hypothetical protein
MNVVAWHRKFRVGATLEMRTVLHRRRLLIDKVEIHDRVFIPKQFMRGESKTVGRQKERECVRGSALLEMRISISNKIDRLKKYL